MPSYNRLLIQSSLMNMEKNPEDANYSLFVDVPADEMNQVIVEGFNPLDDQHAQITVTVVELAGQSDTPEEVETDADPA